MKFPFSYAGLALAFGKAVRKHGAKVLHLGDVNMLTRDLGKALKEQHKTLKNPDLGTIETMKDLVPQLAEVKVLMYAVTKKLGIDTKGKAPFTVLEEIVTTTETNNSTAAKDIKEQLGWIKTFFNNDDVKALLSDQSIAVEMPKSITGIFTTAMQLGSRVEQEISRLHNFMKIAKSTDFSDPPANPTAEEKKDPPKPTTPPPPAV